MPSKSKLVHGGLFLAIGTLGLSVSLLVLGAARHGRSDAGLQGSVAPDFALKNARGATIASGELFKGKISVVLFYPSDNAAFRGMVPAIERLAARYQADGHVTFAGIELERDQAFLGSDRRVKVAPPLPIAGWTVLKDVDGVAAHDFRVGSEPVAFVLTPAGEIFSRIRLANNENAMLACNEAVSALRASATKANPARSLDLGRDGGVLRPSVK